MVELVGGPLLAAEPLRGAEVELRAVAAALALSGSLPAHPDERPATDAAYCEAEQSWSRFADGDGFEVTAAPVDHAGVACLAFAVQEASRVPRPFWRSSCLSLSPVIAKEKRLSRERERRALAFESVRERARLSEARQSVERERERGLGARSLCFSLREGKRLRVPRAARWWPRQWPRARERRATTRSASSASSKRQPSATAREAPNSSVFC